MAREYERFTATVSSVAQQIGTSAQTVRIACDRGIIPSLRTDTGRRMLPENAARHLLEHRLKTGSFTGGCERN